MKFVEKSHHLKRRGRKRSKSRCFRGHNLHPKIRCVFCTLSPIPFFPSDNFFLNSFLIKDDNMYTIIMR